MTKSQKIRSSIPKETRNASRKGNPPVPAIGRRERRAAETRVRLFRCALKLISRRGLTSVTVEDITEAADVGKGTFFNYFPSKEHVLGVLAEIQLGKVREAAAQAQRPGASIQSVLHRLARKLAEEPGRNPKLARALLSSFLSSDAVREILKRNLSVGRKTVGQVIAVGQRNGEIDSRQNPEKIALQFLQTVMGTVLFWSVHEKPKLTTRIEDSFASFWRAAASDKNKKHERRNR